MNKIQYLFRYNTKATTFNYCFARNPNLTTIPANLFEYNKNSATHFLYTFRECSGITSAVPDLWNTSKYPKVQYGNGCFTGCTKAANYTSIPSSWKQ